jgi:hypothetical protein
LQQIAGQQSLHQVARLAVLVAGDVGGASPGELAGKQGFEQQRVAATGQAAGNDFVLSIMLDAAPQFARIEQGRRKKARNSRLDRTPGRLFLSADDFRET